MKYGMEEDDFEKAFEIVDQIVENYYSMVIDKK